MSRKVYSLLGFCLNLSIVYFLVKLKPLSWYELNRFQFLADEVKESILYSFLEPFFDRGDAVYWWYVVTVVLIIMAWKLRAQADSMIKKIVNRL